MQKKQLTTQKTTQLNPEIFKKLNQTLSEFFYEKQRACGLDDLATATNLSRSKISEYIQLLTKKKQIHEIFSGKGVPSIYIPGEAIKNMMKLEPKPKWIKEYTFKEKNEILKEIQNKKQEIDQYDSFERLLYSHDKSLEKSLAVAFEFLGFNNVVYTDNPELHDIEFIFNGCTYIVEAKGKNFQSDKDDVL